MNRRLRGVVWRFREPSLPDHRTRGDRARDAGKWTDAASAYESHLAEAPDDAAIWVQLGHAYKEARYFEQAHVAYDRAAALQPADADIYLNLGHLHKLRGRLDEAIGAYARSAKLAPDLFAGAAMIEIERIHSRMTWSNSRKTAGDFGRPTSLSGLLNVVENAEAEGRRLFSDYYRSFVMR